MNQVGRYQIVEELGRGAMGIVYKALDPKIGRTVAIKTIRFGDLTDTVERDRVRDRLLREAQSAGVLSHPNIVTIYDILEQDGLAYVFMEYVNGFSLERMLSAGTLPEGETLLRFIRQIAAALDYAHHKGVVHRDIKPANVIIAEGGTDLERTVKITDFGVAKFVSHDLTLGGTMIGTPNYMSPEQIQGGTVTAQSDQFSFGVMVYELLSGVKPFMADNLPALFFRICKEDPESLQIKNPTLTNDVDHAVSRALSKDAMQRFISCTDFISALSGALARCPHWRPGTGRLPRETAPPEPPTMFATPVPTATPVVKRYDLPAVRRRRADAREDELDETERVSKKGGGKKLGLILAIVLALLGIVVFVIRWKPTSDLPVQVLDTTTGTSTPPPADAVTPKPQRKQLAESKPAVETVRRPQQRETVAPAPEVESASGGSVELVSDPPGAKITVDNDGGKVCNSPCALALSSGRHTLSVELAGYNLARRVFNVPHDDSLFIPLSKSVGVLIVTSSPQGAQVFVDGHLYGQTPSTLHLPAGKHHLLLVNGGQRHDETLEIENDGFTTRSFKWSEQ